jgi:hypothetical protein
MKDSQMFRSLRAFSRTYAFQALKQFVEQQNTAVALELLSLDLDTPAAKKLQGRPMGMLSLITAIENIPDVADEEE